MIRDSYKIVDGIAYIQSGRPKRCHRINVSEFVQRIIASPMSMNKMTTEFGLPNSTMAGLWRQVATEQQRLERQLKSRAFQGVHRPDKADEDDPAEIARITAEIRAEKMRVGELANELEKVCES